MGSNNQDDNTDIAMANFAKALALPIRIAMIRFILENKNKVKHHHLLVLPYNPQNIEKHIRELQNLEVIKTRKDDGQTYLFINEELFVSMSCGFVTLFDAINKCRNQRAVNTSPIKAAQKEQKLRTALEDAALPTLTEFVKARRMQLHIGQIAFSESINISRHVLNRIETDKGKFPSESLPLIAEVLRVDLDQLKKLPLNSNINKTDKK